ncbi:RNA-binding protein [Candidatus Woesearchaeota archaeon CG_4_10_14_0_8_um_filter_47_5]|nr:MAG: RNA-binding protein [Candidatus Woesearchaeota archaeon CG_4_10_14_0_8_um_filter_47_5]
MVCISTNKPITNALGSVQFPCPKCSNYTIVRSPDARKRATLYTCPQCGFTGPN